MTEREIQEWVAMLGRTVPQRMAVIRNLLQHASEDRMSSSDRLICYQALWQLQAESKALSA